MYGSKQANSLNHQSSQSKPLPFRLFFTSLLAISLLVFGAQSSLAATKCDLDRPIMFAGLDWASNSLHTEIARHILETGYGCKTDSIPGSTIPLMTALSRGDADVMMEVWIDNVVDAWKKGIKSGKVASVGSNFPDAVQGWYVPRYLVEGDAKRGIKAAAPGLKKVTDLPRYKKLFQDPEQRDKGRFYNCIIGWGCEIYNTKKLKAYGFDEHYVNFRPGTGAALEAAIVSNYKKGKPFVAYYWEPTPVMGKHDMILLEEAPYNVEDWNKITASKDGAGVVPVAYPMAGTDIGVNTKFKAEAPNLVKFFSAYTTTSAMVSKGLGWFSDNKKSRGKITVDGKKMSFTVPAGVTKTSVSMRVVAMAFLKLHPEVWTKWVPADVAKKVNASL